MTSEGPAPDHRLHPLSLLFRVGATLRGLLIPIVLVVFASRGSDWDQWLYWAAAVSTVHAVFHYVTYRYRFDGDELVVRHGVLFRSERHVPYERIQNIDLRQNPFHRLLGVADVRIETAGGAEAEADMSVLSLDAVDAMRARVFAGRTRAGRPAVEAEAAGPDVPAPPPGSRPAATGHTLLSLELKDLVLFGIISNRGMAVVLGALGLVYELDLLPDDAPDLGEVAIPETGGPWQVALLGVAAVVAVVVLLRLLSVLWAVVHLHGFVLRREGDDLRASCGLLTRLTATIPRQRIQVVTVTRTLLHRAFGRVAVKVDTAGGSALESKSATRQWVAPLLRAERLPELLAEIQPETPLDGVDWQPIDPRAWRRIVKRRFVVFVLLGALAAWRWGAWAIGGTALVFVLAVFDARRRVQRMRWALTDSAAYVERGVWTRTLRIVRFRKVQVVCLGSSPFDRRWDMASVSVDTAGTDFPVRVPFLPRPVAEGIVERLAGRAAETSFRW